jgi:hypothetical protein
MLQLKSNSKRRGFNRKAATMNAGTKLPALAVAGSKADSFSITSVSNIHYM